MPDHSSSAGIEIASAEIELKSKERALSLEAFQFELAEGTRRDEFFQLHVRCFTQTARLAQRAGQPFQTKDQIHVASHQAFFAHRCDSPNRDRSEMNNEAKLRPFFLLQFFERGDYGHDLFWTCRHVGPVGEKTIAQVFVNYPVLILDDLLATKNPRSEKNVQILTLHVTAEGRKIANVCD